MNAAQKKSTLWLQLAFIAALLLNFSFWMHSRKVLPEWNNVPPAPKIDSARMVSLGDPEIAYRLFGYFLQNVGNTGGRYESLKEYDYALLEKWLMLTYNLNERSDFVPFLAAYYFGAVDDDPEKISHLVNYLAVAGSAPYPEKWRWLAHAVYFARHKEKNMPRALELANQLANSNQNVAAWGRQMPAFVQLGMGNKEAAYEIMIRMIISEKDNLHPNELNFMRSFICERTLSKDEALKNPLCQDIK